MCGTAELTITNLTTVRIFMMIANVNYLLNRSMYLFDYNDLHALSSVGIDECTNFYQWLTDPKGVYISPCFYLIYGSKLRYKHTSET